MRMSLKGCIRSGLRHLSLPLAAKSHLYRDSLGLPRTDVSPSEAIQAGVHWLCAAQDRSTSSDGGVARHYSLISGWGDSYPETTGYIVPTMLRAARLDFLQVSSLRERARRMLDWLVSIQFSEGGFPGGTIGDEPQVPVVFNTGQILLGLAAGAREFGETYVPALCGAADWLVQLQNSDGCWHKHASPFAAQGEKTYDVHVAWGLLETARVQNNTAYADAALANVDWALTKQHPNGWFDKCCLTDSTAPLTHTIAYTLRGILEGYRYSEEPKYLEASERTARSLCDVIGKSGFLPGRLDSNWRKTVSWACLTGISQISHCWLILHQITGKRVYLNAARAANRYVRRTIRTTGNTDIRGGVKGSFPVSGDYGQYQFLNWACKFTVDANILELGLTAPKHSE